MLNISIPTLAVPSNTWYPTQEQFPPYQFDYEVPLYAAAGGKHYTVPIRLHDALTTR